MLILYEWRFEEVGLGELAEKSGGVDISIASVAIPGLCGFNFVDGRAEELLLLLDKDNKATRRRPCSCYLPHDLIQADVDGQLRLSGLLRWDAWQSRQWPARGGRGAIRTVWNSLARSCLSFPALPQENGLTSAGTRMRTYCGHGTTHNRPMDCPSAQARHTRIVNECDATTASVNARGLSSLATLRRSSIRFVVCQVRGSRPKHRC
jgi:hypothetical protein